MISIDALKDDFSSYQRWWTRGWRWIGSSMSSLMSPSSPVHKWDRRSILNPLGVLGCWDLEMSQDFLKCFLRIEKKDFLGFLFSDQVNPYY